MDMRIKLTVYIPVQPFTFISKSLDIYILDIYEGLCSSNLTLQLSIFSVHSLPVSLSETTALCCKLIRTFGVTFLVHFLLMNSQNII
jgi:hypothetical protein